MATEESPVAVATSSNPFDAVEFHSDGSGDLTYVKDSFASGVFSSEFVKLQDLRREKMVGMEKLLLDCSEAQRAVILHHLQYGVRGCLKETVNTLLPTICQQVIDWPLHAQITCAKIIHKVTQNTRLCGTVTRSLSNAAFDVISSTESIGIYESWGEVLVAILPAVRWNGEKDILSLMAIIDSCSVSDHAMSRKLVARILGSLSKCLNIGDVETFVLKTALHLTADRNADVRGMVAESLAQIAAVLDVHFTENYIWPTLQNLRQDSDARIHAAALKTIAKIAEAKRDDSEWSAMRTTLLPTTFDAECSFVRQIVDKDMRKIDNDTYYVLEVVAELFGSLLSSTHSVYVEERTEKNIFLSFKAMVTCNGPAIRRWCAYNFPAVAKCFGSRYRSELTGILLLMSNDSDCEVRMSIAAGLHVSLSFLLDKSSVDNLMKSVLTLMQDSNTQVQEKLLTNLFNVVSSLRTQRELYSLKRISPLIGLLPFFLKGSWRMQELLLNQIEKLVHLIPVKGIEDQILPLLFSIAEESMYLVRRAAMLAIARAIGCLPFPNQRKNAVCKLNSKWCEGEVFWMRLAYIDCATAASGVLSARLFNSLFASSLFSLSDDSIPNVRGKLSRSFESLVPVCHGNDEFHNALEKLRRDSDKEVSYALERVDNLLRSKHVWTDDFNREDKVREASEREQHERASKEEKGSKDRQRRRASSFLPKLGKSSVSEDANGYEGNSPSCNIDGSNFGATIKQKSAFVLKNAVGWKNKGSETPLCRQLENAQSESKPSACGPTRSPTSIIDVSRASSPPGRKNSRLLAQLPAEDIPDQKRPYSRHKEKSYCGEARYDEAESSKSDGKTVFKMLTLMGNRRKREPT